MSYGVGELVVEGFGCGSVTGVRFVVEEYHSVDCGRGGFTS